MDITLTESGEIVLTADELAKFARAKSKKAAPDMRPSAESYGDADVFSSFLYKTIKYGETFIVTGDADGIYTFGDECIVEMIKSAKRVSPSTNPYSDPVFLAKAYVCAFLVCRGKGRDSVTIKLTISAENGTKHFDTVQSIDVLSKTVDALLERAANFAIVKKRFETDGKRDIEKMPFPYPTIRDGQRDFIKEAYRAIKKERRLIVSAPTGIGKTVSALFPAVKAIGEGVIDKAFYLTAKTVTGIAAAKTAEAMRRHVPDLRAVTVTAKERCCPSKDKRNDFFVERCSRDCPRLLERDGASYNERRDEALRELLSGGGVYGKAEIYASAEKHFLCPYELSLDLSEYCQIVICDYNYVFDPRVKFRRYFSEGGLKYVFLIDEAHNLPDRTRDMFSSSIVRADVEKLRDVMASSSVPSGALYSKCESLINALDYITELCLEDSEQTGDTVVGHYIANRVPEKLQKAAEAYAQEASRAIRNIEDEEVLSAADKLYSDCSDLTKSCEYFDEHFIFFAELTGAELTLRAMCLDPSEILDTAMRGAVSTILFSATLDPVSYYADITGSPDAATLELESPYPAENLCIAAVDTVSTKYLARRETADEVAQIILTVIEARRGHYIVYFPSYKYMSTVFDSFSRIAPKGVAAVVQKQGMSIDARKKFLSFFENESADDTLVGFCVLGGVFSEGIDLPDEKLIGAVLVGIGLPSLSSELNILKEYFDRTREDGYNFAYLYPAMIKTAQAAGRVIRSESDRGVVVLIDERYRDPNLIKLLPAHWRDLHYTGDSRSLAVYLEKFWNK